jgi:hypothetical protein
MWIVRLLIIVLLALIFLYGCASQEFKDFCDDLYEQGWTTCIDEANRGYRESLSKDQFERVLEQIDYQD